MPLQSTPLAKNMKSPLFEDGWADICFKKFKLRDDSRIFFLVIPSFSPMTSSRNASVGDPAPPLRSQNVQLLNKTASEHPPGGLPGVVECSILNQCERKWSKFDKFYNSLANHLEFGFKRCNSCSLSLKMQLFSQLNLQTNAKVFDTLQHTLKLLNGLSYLYIQKFECVHFCGVENFHVTCPLLIKLTTEFSQYWLIL